MRVPTTQDDFSQELALGIITSALDVFLRTSDIVALAEKLPGLLAVLGGPNLGMRRLNTTGGLLTSTADLATGIAGVFQGNPDVDGIVTSSRDILKHIVSLVEDR